MTHDDAGGPRTLFLAEERFDPLRFEAEARMVEILCVGDSLTGWNNFGAPSTWPFRCYPEFLQAQLHEAGFPQRVANAGMAGEVSKNGPGALWHFLDLFPRARWVVIALGGNDFSWAADSGHTSQEVLANLDRMVAMVRQRGSTPLLFEVTPVGEGPFRSVVAGLTPAVIEAHNQALRRFGAENGVRLVPTGDRLRPELLGDGVHPTDEGARAVARAVFEALVELLPDPTGLGASR